MRTSNFALIAVLCAAPAFSAKEEETERKIKAKDVPAPVASAAARAYPGIKIRSWAKETEAGSTMYEASMVDGGRERDVLYAPDGATLAVEETIPVAELPAAVKDAVKAKYPKGVIHLAEKITKGQEIQYEVALKKAAKKEVVLSPDGKIVKEE